MTEAIRIFLDSSDYSMLSDPSKQTPALADTLQELLDLRDSGQIRFYYSGTILSEMAPLDPAYASAAEQRTDMLVRLCGNNALAWHSTILAIELASAYEVAGPVFSAYSDTGDWYPFNISKTITNVLSGPGVSRAERRKAQKQLLIQFLDRNVNIFKA